MKRSEAVLGVDREGVRANNALTSQQQEPLTPPNPRIDALVLDSLPAIARFTRGHPYNFYGLVAWLRRLP